PFEPTLMQYLRRNWRRRDEIADLRNDIYVQVYEAALRKLPDKPHQFVVTTARNLLIDRLRRERIVPMEAMADLDALETTLDAPSPERITIARDELRLLQNALEQLPRRTREVIVMRRVEGLSRAQISVRLGISEETISAHVTDGMRALTEMLFGATPKLRDKA
ncbi:MAG TPA: sigma-70 family RNA polymerase sigma factor, partial [Rhizomicrobium sp.]|nr:sigma-70 family RNA polymerase sigma factor [Rhizomicrobium sp.]